MRLDLATEWRSRRWRRLLNVIDRLPRDSAFMEAMSDDDELADRMLRQRDDSKPPTPRRRMSDWSPTVEVLTAILDRLGELTQTVAALGGAKPGKLPRAPYPITAFDRARHRRRVESHKSLVSRVLRKDPPIPPAV
jgi:hypothetical protein